MQYHAVSLARSGYHVALVGGVGEPCVEDVEQSERITEHRLRAVPWCGGGNPKSSWEWCRCSRKLFLLYAPFKILFQVLQLLFVLLFAVPQPQAVIVQNPPSIPTLGVVWLVCRMRGSRFIVDWHNFGYTILEMTMPPEKACGFGRVVLALAKAYECMFGTCADASFCVTHSMQRWLLEKWGVHAQVLHDRPPSFFRRTPIAMRHDLFTRLKAGFLSCDTLDSGSDSGSGSGLDQSMKKIGKEKDNKKRPILNHRTLFTESATQLRADRPALVLSSTSWTPDEDFGVLLNAIEIVARRAEERRAERGHFPRMVFVVTGKGPQRAYYEEKIAQMDLASRGFHFLTMWLEASDYPLLLGAADLGVCLHTSSSGLDLPMKVVDMFGCRLPVCAIGFECLDELVQHGVNGLVFQDAEMLADQIFDLFEDFPEKKDKLDALADGVGFKLSWHENWIKHALPTIEGGREKTK